MQPRIVLVADQDLGNVALGDQAQPCGGAAQRRPEVGKRWHVRPGPYPGSATMSEIEYTVRRSERARRVRVTVDAARGVEVVLPRRAAEREAAAAVRELSPWIGRRLAELARARET